MSNSTGDESVRRNDSKEKVTLYDTTGHHSYIVEINGPGSTGCALARSAASASTSTSATSTGTTSASATSATRNVSTVSQDHIAATANGHSRYLVFTTPEGLAIAPCLGREIVRQTENCDGVMVGRT